MLKRFRQISTKKLIFLSLIGPGLLTAIGDNDAGGIASNSAAGAHFGYSFLWILFVITIALTVILDMCARMGVVTGKGLMDLIREKFGVRWSALVIISLFIANAAAVVSNMGGIAGGMEIFGLSRYIGIPLVAIAVFFLLRWGSYKIIERILLLISMIVLCYIASAIVAKPDWGMVLKQTLIPSIKITHDYLMLVIAFVGTTIAPWMLFFIQSMIVDKGLTIKHINIARWEVWLSSFLSDYAISFFIIIACATTLFRHQIRIESVSDAAIALRPLAGDLCFLLFAIGLLAASTLAIFLLPLTSAYAVCETFGFEGGLNKSPSEAPVFYGTITLLLFVGSAVVLLPGISIFPLIILAQVVAGVITPILVVFITLLAGNQRIMGKYVNSSFYNIIAGGTVAGIVIVSIIYLGLILSGKTI